MMHEVVRQDRHAPRETMNVRSRWSRATAEPAPHFRRWPADSRTGSTANRNPAAGHDVGLVAFADHGGAWVAAGEPVASEADAVPAAERFVEAAQANGRRASFFATEGNLASSPRFRRTLIGEQPVWDPRAWHSKVQAHRSLREQLRRARAKGVVVRSISSADLQADTTLQQRSKAWSRAGWHRAPCRE